MPPTPRSGLVLGTSAYLPNLIDSGLPEVADVDHGGYVQTPRVVEGQVVRGAPASFDDHFSQATMFFRSMTPLEQAHIVEAYTFELGKVYEKSIRERVLTVLANVDTDLCEQVAAGLGLPAPSGSPADVVPSPALSQVVTEPGPIAGRKIGVIAGPGADLAGIGKLRKGLAKQGATVHVIAPVGGELKKGRTVEIIERSFATARSIEFDAFVVAGGTEPTGDIKSVLLLQEAYRHCKPVAAWGDGDAVLIGAGIPTDGPGVLLGDAVDAAWIARVVATVGLHRVWTRAPLIMASAVAPAV